MGTAASSDVKSVAIHQDTSEPIVNELPSRPWSSISAKQKVKKSRQKDNQIEELKIQLDRCHESLSAEKNRSQNALEEVKSLEIQVGGLESGRLDREEQIQALEEQLEYMHTQNLVTRPPDFSETVAAKDQCIARLQQETEAVKDEIRKLKIRYKKRLRSINVQLAEAKQENSVQLCEQRQEVGELQEMNEKLLGSGAVDVAPSRASSTQPTSPLDDGRSKIIIELSARISEQEERILSLEQNIRERDSVIRELQARCSAGSGPQERQTGHTTDLVTRAHEGASVAKDLQDDDGHSAEMAQIARDMKELQASRRKKKRAGIRSKPDAPRARVPVVNISRGAGIDIRNDMSNHSWTNPYGLSDTRDGYKPREMDSDLERDINDILSPGRSARELHSVTSGPQSRQSDDLLVPSLSRNSFYLSQANDTVSQSVPVT